MHELASMILDAAEMNVICGDYFMPDKLDVYAVTTIINDFFLFKVGSCISRFIFRKFLLLNGFIKCSVCC